MANEGMDFELLVNIKKAEQQIDKFIKDTEKKFNKTNYSPIGSGSKGGGSSGSSSTNKVLNEQKKAYEKLKQQRIKANEQRIRDEEKANQNIQKQRQKANQDRINEAKRVNQQIQKIRRDALHKYEMMEIQRNRAGQNATEQSKRMRIEYEREISRIVAHASSSNLARVKQELAKELAIRRKALDQRIMSERQAAAQQLAVRNHSQKQASKFNNMMFQVQQAVEDASYAGFRGASNNLALMANQLGGPGGTIALMGLMATTMTPTIAKLVGFGDAAETAAQKQQKLNDSIARYQQLKVDSDVRLKSSIFDTNQTNELKTEIGERSRKLKEMTKSISERKQEEKYLQEAQNQLEFRKKNNYYLGNMNRYRSDLNAKAENKGVARRSESTAKMLRERARAFEKAARERGINLNDKSTDPFTQSIRKQKEAENKFSSVTGTDIQGSRQKDYSWWEKAMGKKTRPERGTLPEEVIKDMLKKRKEQTDEWALDIRDEKKKIALLKEQVGNTNKDLQEMYKKIKEGPKIKDTSLRVGKVDMIDSLRQKNHEQQQSYEDMLNKKKESLSSLYDKALIGINSQESPADQAREVESWTKIIAKEEKQITDEIAKQSTQYEAILNKEENRISALEDALDLNKKINREIERSVEVHQKKVQSLQDALTMSQQEYQYDKLSAQSSVEAMKINDQGEKQMKQAKNFASKRFDPMIKYLQYMSKSPVFGQAASQQLQAVQNAKATLLQKAQNKISKLTEKKLYKEKQNLIGKQSTFLQDKANAAGSSGNFEMQQKYLEQLQALKLQASGSSKTPQEAQKYLKEADSIQNQLVKSMSNQITTEKQSLNELTKIEAQLAQIKSILQGNPNSAQAKQAQSTLNGLQSKVTAINDGKPLPNVAMPTPTLPAATPPVPKKWAGKYSAFSNQPTVPAPPVTQPVPPRINPAPIVPQDKPQSLKDIIREMERDSVTQTQSVQAQSVTQAQANQTMTNSATISNAVINSATINGVINDKTPTPAVAGSSVSNVMNNRFGSLNLNVKGPRLPNIGKQLQRQARNQSIRMG